MESVPITCPNCGFSKEVPEQRIPKGSVRATCRQCLQSFTFRREDRVQVRETTPLPPVDEAVSAPGETADAENRVEDSRENEQRIFYEIVSYRVSPREYWWGSKGNPITFVIALVLKILRIRIPSSTDDPNVESLRPFEVQEDRLSADLRALMQPLMLAFQGLGFHSPIFHVIRDVVSNTKTCLVTYCSSDGSALGRVHLRIWSSPHPERVHIFPEFLSATTDGSFLWSLAAQPDMLAPPCCHVQRKPGASPEELWALHRKSLCEIPRERLAHRCGSREEGRLIMERHHAAVRDFHLQRGVFRPMTAEVQTAADKTAERLLAREAEGREHGEVLEELERLQQPKRGWGSALWIFTLSAALFVGTGASRWSWDYLLLLMLVLLFHESGHFIAMKFFSYRNLRIFFIPMFGAAVSGRNFNVPVWKKVIVSLMGPVPGIVLGIIAGVAGLSLQHGLLLQAGILLLILNGLNLLPVLPLDGGWVAHNLFFSRHYLFDSGFRLFAALALIGAGMRTNDKVLWLLGAFMLVTLPQSHRRARVAYSLRKRGFQAISDDNCSIPVEQAEVIIREVKKAFPARVTNKVIAQLTLSIFETLNARPAHWLATLGLVGVHVGSLVAAVVFSVIFIGIGRGL